MSEDLECSRCHSKGFITGPDPKRAAFLEKQGWRKVGGKWVCNFCTGIGIPGLSQEPEI